jgi:phospholipid/cholesterol/gamma-HCH transport system permease protein
MNATARPAIQFEPALQYSIGSLLWAILSVGGRCLPHVIAGRATVVDREAVREVLSFLFGTARSAALTAFVYGLATVYAVLSNTSSPAAFETLVLPHLGGAFLQYVIPFAIANLVVLKSVVGMTSDIVSMRVSQEVDAIEAVGLHPAEMIFAPRALALLITAPALAVLGVYCACLGAWLASWIMVGTGIIEFIPAFESSVTSGALLLAVTKLAITALAMSILGGYYGFIRAKPEQGSVGHITTSAVSTAVFSTIIVNLLLSVLGAAFHLE